MISVPKPYCLALSWMPVACISIFFTSISQSDAAMGTEHIVPLHLCAALRAEFRLFLPWGTIHTFQRIGIVHDVRYPSSAAVALIEESPPFRFPCAAQHFFRCSLWNRFCCAQRCAGGFAEEAEPHSAAIPNDFVRCRMMRFLCHKSTSLSFESRCTNLD